MSKTLIEYFGWYGVVAILTAYAINVFHVVDSTAIIFLLLNATGSAGIVLVSWRKHTFQPMVLNLLWLGIAIAGLLQLLT